MIILGIIALTAYLVDLIEHLFPYYKGIVVGKDHNVIKKFNDHLYIIHVQYDNGHKTIIKHIKVTKDVFEHYHKGDYIIVK